MAVQEQSGGAAHKYVADRAGHFMPSRPVDFAAAVWQIGMQPFLPILYLPYDRLDIRLVRPVRVQGFSVLAGLLRSVQPQIGGYARAGVQSAYLDSRVNDILGHLSIGCPFSSRDGNQAGPRNADNMIARDGSGIRRVACIDKGAQSGKGAQYIGRSDTALEIMGRMVYQVFDLVGARQRFERRSADGGIGSAQQYAPMPGKGEEYAAVFCPGDQKRVPGGKERSIQYKVDTLARTHKIGTAGRVLLPDSVHEDAAGVHDGVSVEMQFLAGFKIAGYDPIHLALRFEEPDNTGVIDHCGAVASGCAGQGEGQTGVVELTVVINDAAAQSAGLYAGEFLQRPRPRKQVRLPEGAAARQQVVGLQSQAVKRAFPPGIGGKHELQVAHQVRRIVAEPAALAQCFTDQRHVALPQISDAAMDQFCAAA